MNVLSILLLAWILHSDVLDVDCTTSEDGFNDLNPWAGSKSEDGDVLPFFNMEILRNVLGMRKNKPAVTTVSSSSGGYPGTTIRDPTSNMNSSKDSRIPAKKAPTTHTIKKHRKVSTTEDDSISETVSFSGSVPDDFAYSSQTKNFYSFTEILNSNNDKSVITTTVKESQKESQKDYIKDTSISNHSQINPDLWNEQNIRKLLMKKNNMATLSKEEPLQDVQEISTLKLTLEMVFEKKGDAKLELKTVHNEGSRTDISGKEALERIDRFKSAREKVHNQRIQLKKPSPLESLSTDVSNQVMRSTLRYQSSNVLTPDAMLNQPTVTMKDSEREADTNACISESNRRLVSESEQWSVYPSTITDIEHNDIAQYTERSEIKSTEAAMQSESPPSAETNESSSNCDICQSDYMSTETNNDVSGINYYMVQEDNLPAEVITVADMVDYMVESESESSSETNDSADGMNQQYGLPSETNDSAGGIIQQYGLPSETNDSLEDIMQSYSLPPETNNAVTEIKYYIAQSSETDGALNIYKLQPETDLTSENKIGMYSSKDKYQNKNVLHCDINSSAADFNNSNKKSHNNQNFERNNQIMPSTHYRIQPNIDRSMTNVSKINLQKWSVTPAISKFPFQVQNQQNVTKTHKGYNKKYNLIRSMYPEEFRMPTRSGVLRALSTNTGEEDEAILRASDASPEQTTKPKGLFAWGNRNNSSGAPRKKNKTLVIIKKTYMDGGSQIPDETVNRIQAKDGSAKMCLLPGRADKQKQLGINQHQHTEDDELDEHGFSTETSLLFQSNLFKPTKPYQNRVNGQTQQFSNVENFTQNILNDSQKFLNIGTFAPLEIPPFINERDPDWKDWIPNTFTINPVQGKKVFKPIPKRIEWEDGTEDVIYDLLQLQPTRPSKYLATVRNLIPSTNNDRLLDNLHSYAKSFPRKKEFKNITNQFTGKQKKNYLNIDMKFKDMDHQNGVGSRSSLSFTPQSPIRNYSFFLPMLLPNPNRDENIVKSRGFIKNKIQPEVRQMFPVRYKGINKEALRRKESSSLVITANDNFNRNEINNQILYPESKQILKSSPKENTLQDNLKNKILDSQHFKGIESISNKSLPSIMSNHTIGGEFGALKMSVLKIVHKLPENMSQDTSQDDINSLNNNFRKVSKNKSKSANQKGHPVQKFEFESSRWKNNIQHVIDQNKKKSESEIKFEKSLDAFQDKLKFIVNHELGHLALDRPAVLRYLKRANEAFIENEFKPVRKSIQKPKRETRRLKPSDKKMKTAELEYILCNNLPSLPLNKGKFINCMTGERNGSNSWSPSSTYQGTKTISKASMQNIIDRNLNKHRQKQNNEDFLNKDRKYNRTKTDYEINV